jgi:methionine-S-sulfoxide reductase
MTMRSTLVAATLVFLASCVGDTTAAPRAPQKPAPAKTSPTAETAYLAGGCFWGMEQILRGIPGVIDTEVGIVQGAETVRIVFEPAQLSYDTLLHRWFFRMHDPTTQDRQGNDVGRSYRSAIFYTSDAQRRTAEEVKARVAREKRWPDPIVTEIAPADAFVASGPEHQDYLQKNPDGYTCHFLRDWVI